MTIVTINSRNQIVIPAALRSRPQFQPGRKFQFIERDGDILFRPLPRGKDLIGLLKSTRPLHFKRDKDRQI